jgi:cobalt/nickel transport system permease protein
MHAHLPARPPPASPLHRAPTLLKFVATLALVLTTSLLPPRLAAWLLLPAGLLLVVTLAARLPPRPLVRRVILLEPFILGVALLALLSPPPAGGLRPFLFLAARSTLALWALLVFSTVTPFSDLLALSRTLRIPHLLVTTLALMHRYLFVLADESARMRRARAARTFSPKKRLAWTTASTVVAQLFLRASARADRIYDAMRSRGWDG